MFDLIAIIVSITDFRGGSSSGEKAILTHGYPTIANALRRSTTSASIQIDSPSAMSPAILIDGVSDDRFELLAKVN